MVGRQRGHVRAVRVAGEVDLATANLVADALRLASGRGIAVVVDLADVRFADTSLGYALVTARARQLRDAGSLTVINMPSAVWRLLHAARFAEELGIGTSSAGPRLDRAAARCSARPAALPACSPRISSAR
jgi:anti-anti-sigma factor